jgi:hypothetical protein
MVVSAVEDETTVHEKWDLITGFYLVMQCILIFCESYSLSFQDWNLISSNIAYKYGEGATMGWLRRLRGCYYLRVLPKMFKTTVLVAAFTVRWVLSLARNWIMDDFWTQFRTFQQDDYFRCFW